MRCGRDNRLSAKIIFPPIPDLDIQTPQCPLDRLITVSRLFLIVDDDTNNTLDALPTEKGKEEDNVTTPLALRCFDGSFVQLGGDRSLFELQPG